MSSVKMSSHPFAHRPGFGPLRFAPLVALLLAACGGGGSSSAPESASQGASQDVAATAVAAASTDVDTLGTQARESTASAPLVVRAKASLAGNVGAIMQVHVNGQMIGSTEVRSPDWKEFSFPTTALTAGAGVDIVYTNDAKIGAEDRNLYIQYVSAGNVFAMPDGPNTTLDRGTGAAAFDGDNVIAGQSALYTNGALRMVWPSVDATSSAGTERFEASRFLQQASFGPTVADIDHVVDIGYEAWITEQMALPHHPVFVGAVQSYFDLGDAYRPGGASYTNRWPAQQFWANVIRAPDQLRRRVAFELHHMLMVSLTDGSLYRHSRPYAKYLDTLNQYAFGNYRELMEAVALSPAMGIYLSHMRNQAEDPAAGRNPDENFARELMQLFSIGLVQLKLNGTPQLDALGLPIETYTNQDVMALAKVFTGWSWGYPDSELTHSNFMWHTPSYAAATDRQVDLKPMKAYPGEHSTAVKELFAGKPWAVNIPAGTDAQTALEMALDGLFQHPNVGPFVGRQLIQRLVTSHPSSGYVYRVARVFNDNGKGVRGDLGAVVRAILLDVEARTPHSGSTGKLREPVLRVAHWMRAFDAWSSTGKFMMADDLKPLEQQALYAPSVFGYFRPGYVPPNTALADKNKTAPEFQIVNEASVSHWFNTAQQMITAGMGWTGTARDVTSSYATLKALAAKGDVNGMVGNLDLLLYAGKMPSSVRHDIVEAMAGVGGQANDSHLKRARVALLMALTAPEYLVQH